MERGNIINQIAAVSEVIDKVGAVSSMLFQECKNQTLGCPTSKCNEHYNSDFKPTQDALYEALKVLSVRLYELDQEYYKTNKNND